MLNLKNLKISINLQEIIGTYKRFKRNIFENWCGLHYQEANEIKNQFWDQIKRCVESTDPADSVRVCIGSIILAKYSQTFRDNCSNLLQNIRPQRENAFSVFISIYTAKYAKRFRSSSQFTQIYLQNILESLKLNNIRSFDKHYLNLLYYLTVYATKEIDKYTLLFYEALVNAFENSSDENKIYAMRTLNNYFRLTRQKQLPQYLQKQARTFISQKNHGGLLILVSLIDFFPEYYLDSDIPSVYTNLINSMKKDSRTIYSCNLLQIALASNFPNDFRNIVEMILKNNWPDDKSKFTLDFIFPISFILQKFPQGFIGKDNNCLPQLLDLIKNLISKVEDRTITDMGSSLLINFMNNLPNEFENYAEKVAHILLIPDYGESFISTFKQIITQNETVCKLVLRDIESLLTLLFEDKRDEKLIIFSQIISSLPSVPERIVKKLKDPLINLLNHPNINVRKKVPPALLAISKYFPSQISVQIITVLISSAVVEESVELRLNILNSFTEPYPSYLAYPNILEYFSILINDESFNVRRSVIKILGGVVSKNPAMIYPMFRRILLDILFLLGASKSLRMKSEAILCLPIIFSSVIPILPIYIPIFMPIALQQLKKNLSVASNEIDNPQNFKTVPFYQHPIMSYSSISSFQKFPYERQLSNSYDFKPPNSGFSNSSVSTIKESVAQRIISDEQMSFFERIFTTKITEQSIITIGCICEKSFSLIRPFIKEITKILLETIGRAAHKTILLASIDTLGKIIDQIGPIEAANITDLNTTLLKLGSRIISSKVFTAIFRTLGKIGPIAPQNSLNIEISEVKAPENVNLSVSRDDYYVRAVVTSLFFVLDDKSESDLHSDAHLALSRTFSTCKKSVNSQRLFKSYVARLLTTIRALAPDDRSKYFKYIATILRCPVEWLQPFSRHFFQLIEDLWDTENNVDVLDLIPKLASRLKDEFSHYMPRVVSRLLDALISSCSCTFSNENFKPHLILKTFCELSKLATQFIFIIINQICVILVEFKIQESIEIAAIDSLRSLIQTFNCTPHSSIIMRACFHLARKNPYLKDKILQVIYSLAVSMGPKFLNYSDSIKDNELMTIEMEQILNFFSLKKRKKLSDFPFILVDKKEPEMYEWKPNTEIDEADLINITSLQSGNNTDEAWKSWIRTFIKSFITHSPVPAIQSCMPIAEKSPLFNRKIFNPAFLSCWAKLKNESRRSIQMVISQALSYYISTPSSVVTALIGLFEFMDRAGMPIEGNFFIRTKSAMNAGKRTFALYCAQRDFDTTRESARNIEFLIQIYSQLGMFDEVRGMEKIAPNLVTRVEKIDQKLNKLELAEQWTSISKCFNNFLTKAEPEEKRSNVTFAHAFYHLNDWKNFDVSIQQDQDSPNSIIMNCLRGLYLKKDISSLIEEGFTKLGKQGGPLFLHGFTAVAPYIVNAEQLVEIQEYFTKKNIDHWEKRLVPIKCTFNTIRPLLHMRMDLLQNEGPMKVFPHQLSFLKLARKANEWDAFEQFYNLHFSESDLNKTNRLQKLQIKYEYLHLLRKKSSTNEALNYLDNCLLNPPKNVNEKEIFSKFYFKKAKWIARLINEDVADQMSQVIDLCNKSLEMRPQHYSVKNLWSWANMHLFTSCSNQDYCFTLLDEEEEQKVNTDNKSVDFNLLAQAAINAISGFASCLKMDFKETFFDLLQMTSILFRSTSIPGVFDASIGAVKSVQLKRFIKVIPQLLVYQYTHSVPHQKLVYEILSKLLTQYPNSVIFPLLFVNNTKRNTNIGVSDMLKSFAMNHSEFYESAVNVLQGLQKACITLPEYFTEAMNKIKNKIKKKKFVSVENLIPVLIYRLKKALNAANSPYEAAFVKKHRNALTSVLLTIEKYMQDHNMDNFQLSIESWGEYYNKIREELQKEVQLSLKYIAPELENLDSNAGMSSMIALMSSSSSPKTPNSSLTKLSLSEEIKQKQKQNVTRFNTSEANQLQSTLIDNKKKLSSSRETNKNLNVNDKNVKNNLLNIPIEQVLSPANCDSENSLTRRHFEEKAKKRQKFYNFTNDDEQQNEKDPTNKEESNCNKAPKSMNNILNIKAQVVDSPAWDDSFTTEKNRKNLRKSQFYHITKDDGSESEITSNKNQLTKSNQFMKSAKQVMSPSMTDSDGSLAGSKVSLNNLSSQLANDAAPNNKTQQLQKEKPLLLSKLTKVDSLTSDDSFIEEKKRKQLRKQAFYHITKDDDEPENGGNENNSKLPKSGQFMKNSTQIMSPEMTDSDSSLTGNKVSFNNSSAQMVESTANNNRNNNNQKLQKEKPLLLSKLTKVDSLTSDDSFIEEKNRKQLRKQAFYHITKDDDEPENDSNESNSGQLANLSQSANSSSQITTSVLSESEGSKVSTSNLSSQLTESTSSNAVISSQQQQQQMQKEKPLPFGKLTKVDSLTSDDSFVEEKNRKQLRKQAFYHITKDDDEPENVQNNSSSNRAQLTKSTQFMKSATQVMKSATQVMSPETTDSDSSLAGSKVSFNNSSAQMAESTANNSSNITNSSSKQKLQKEKPLLLSKLTKVDSLASDDSFIEEKNRKQLRMQAFYHITKDDDDTGDDQNNSNGGVKLTKSSQFMKSATQVMSPVIPDSDSSQSGSKVSFDNSSAQVAENAASGAQFSKSLQFMKSSKQVMSPNLTDSDGSLTSIRCNDEQIRKQNLYVKQLNETQKNIDTSSSSSSTPRPVQNTKSSNSSTSKSSTATDNTTGESKKEDNCNDKKSPSRNSASKEPQSPHVVNMMTATATASKLRTERHHQCQLAVFNTFDPDKPIITITKFNDLVKIKLSKHRPRKIIITGSDGRLYKFLLKGHEDLRVDQRMMQYFELMNSIAPASIPQIIITGVTPLAPNCGLIQWVPQCDLMKGLIIEFRKIGLSNESIVDNLNVDNNNNDKEDDKNNDEKKEDRIFKEISMMKSMTTFAINDLMPIQRLEPIRNIIKETSPNDLRDMMWLKAQDAESWVRHTLNFSKTSAVMSIVGYIIGLGDRHPANIMIQRSSGRVIHIDFGDYFEVAKERKFLAEKIPFRLTRMMIATFGPCGIEGSYRTKCEETVQTIREHREAVMSILEIFIREPCSSGDFFYNSNKIENKIEVISGSVGIDQYMKFGSNKSHDKLLKNMSTISKKIDGLDFDNKIPLSISEQVDKLINSATDLYNLAYLYHGWNPLW